MTRLQHIPPRAVATDCTHCRRGARPPRLGGLSLQRSTGTPPPSPPVARSLSSSQAKRTHRPGMAMSGGPSRPVSCLKGGCADELV
jgi:hypothetical protein